MEDQEFAPRYGPWAVVVGASEGIGAAFAREVAARGLGVVLVARRQPVLEQVAADIEAGTGAATRVVAADLSTAAGVQEIIDATADLEVGLLLYAAGADPAFAPFLSQPVEDAVGLVERNCLGPIRLCHHFAAPMQAAGRGGIVLISSGGGLVGGPNMVAYGASKAFDMVMAEALWAELEPHGVDVLGLVTGKTDTPALRRLLQQRGQLPDLDTPAPGAATVEQVVAAALDNLRAGPTCFATPDVAHAATALGAMTRNDAARAMRASAAAAMGADQEVPA